jgi:hypothetical protein
VDKDPATEAALVVADFGASVEAGIRACVRVKDAVESFAGDRARLDMFIDGLVQGGVLSAAEAEMGLDSPKLSKLRKAGEHADLLRRPEVFSQLKPGYTILYHTVLLHEVLNGNEEERRNELVRKLQAAGAELSREYLIEQTKLAKLAIQAAQITQTKGAEQEGPAIATLDAAAFMLAPILGKTLGSLIEARHTFDLLMLKPAGVDLTYLGRDYGEVGALASCLPLHQILDEDAVVAIVVRLRDLRLATEVLLPLCGIARLSRVLLPRRPASPDVTDDEVVVAACRGEAQLGATGTDAWVKGEGSIDFASLAARLAPSATRRLELFSHDAPPEGWHSIAAGNSWVAMPSV